MERHLTDAAIAILLLKRGSPLPVDLETKLLAAGIDVAALRARYAD